MKPVWWAVSLLLMAVIWALGTAGVSLPAPLGWLGHALEYLALGFALGRATGRPGLALGLAAWFGAADEVRQAFVAGRDAGIQNWLWGLLGAWTGVRWSARRGGTPAQHRASPQSSETQTREAQTSENPR